jgi:hypothetical protein
MTEETVEPLLKASEPEIRVPTFTVRWGPRYDPEMIVDERMLDSVNRVILRLKQERGRRPPRDCKCSATNSCTTSQTTRRS